MEQEAVVGDPFAERDSFKLVGQHGSLQDRKTAFISSSTKEGLSVGVGLVISTANSSLNH